MIHLNCYLSELENEMLNDEHSSNVSHHSAKKNTKEKDCSAEQEVENEMLNDEHVSHHSANKNTKEKDCSAEQEVENEMLNDEHVSHHSANKNTKEKDCSAEQEVENEPKLQNCYYCGKQYKKIARHLTDIHSDEVEVAKALAFPIRSQARNKQWDKLRNLGNFDYNFDVLKKGTGKIIPKKRTKLASSQSGDYVPCPSCKGMFAKAYLWRHVKN